VGLLGLFCCVLAQRLESVGLSMVLGTAGLIGLLKSGVMLRTHAGGWAFALLWPGMNVSQFEGMAPIMRKPWLRSAAAYAITGALLLYADVWPLLGWWLVLMGGAGNALAAFWWWLGNDVRRVMAVEECGGSLGRFWAVGFCAPLRDAVMRLVILPLKQRQRTGNVLLFAAAFLTYGMLAEMMLLMAGQEALGRGILYFAIQAVGVGMERRWLRGKEGSWRWLLMMVWVAAPIFFLKA
jgi:hypothetical protein